VVWLAALVSRLRNLGKLLVVVAVLATGDRLRAQDAGGGPAQPAPHGKLEPSRDIDKRARDGEVEPDTSAPVAPELAPAPADQPTPGLRRIPDDQPTPGLRRIPDDRPAPGLRRIPDAPPPPEPPASGPLLPVAAATDFKARATATRTPDARPSTATVTRVDRVAIDRSPALTTDGVLRSLPSVATFRRSSSLVADPSSQGLNLRGLAPSGVSRTLVLIDGIPANDPFGGWVYWRALPRLGLDHIEVVPGGGSALYGSAALGGVVQLFARPPSQQGVELDASYGSLDTLALGTRIAHQFGVLGAALEGEYLNSDGYRIVSGADRGPVDGPTPSEHGNIDGRFTLAITPKLKLATNLNYFREVQNGGTRFTTAEVSMGLASVGLVYDLDRAGQLELSLFGRRERFGQVRARIDDARENETRAGQQSVPSGDEGGALTWTSPALRGFGEHQILVGVDARHIAGESTDRIDPAMPQPDSVLVKRASGDQWFAGGFVQDVVRIENSVDLQANLRADAFRNYDAAREIVRADGKTTRTDGSARSASTLSPRLGLLFHVQPWLQLRAAGYRAFRAPTLNELYRSFQVGTISTAANDRLGPEHALGGELGLELQTAETRLRLTGFVSLLEDPIVNATLPSPLPDGSTRQRQNLGGARVHGLELEARFSFNRFSRVEFGYTWAHSEVTDAGPMRMLVGKRLPQDPEHRATLAVLFDNPRWLSGIVQVRVIGPQWEDDLNTLTMNGFALLDANLSRVLSGGWEIFAAAENIFNTRYLVGRAGVDTLGAPFTFRIGFRIRSRYRP
jgi:outer membrane receptor protein involved in Fe transport